MSWIFGKKQSYRSLLFCLFISFLIFGISLFASNNWQQLFSCVLLAVITFVVLVTVIYPIFLPMHLNYVKIDSSGIEFYKVESWWDKINLVFNPNFVLPIKITYPEIKKVSVITGKRIATPQKLIDSPADISDVVMPKLPDGIEITTVNREKIVAETNWPDTSERCKLDEALEFVRENI